jgi:hypothetical protein
MTITKEKGQLSKYSKLNNTFAPTSTMKISERVRKNLLLKLSLETRLVTIK